MPHQAATSQPDSREIQRLRKHHRLTQEGLAKRTGISAKTIGRIERGQRTSPEFLGFIAEALGTTIEKITLDDPAVAAPNTRSAEPAPARAGGPDPAEEIRHHLHEVADRDLRKRLHSTNPDEYIAIELQEGLVAPAHRIAESSETAVVPLDFGRKWTTLDPQTLVLPRQAFFLTSVGGSGKTVFLRHLQKQVSMRPDMLPFYLKASELDALNSLSWKHVRALLSDKLGPVLPGASIDAALDDAFVSNRLLLLVDSMGSPLAPRRRHDEFVDQLIEGMDGGLVIFAGRPSVAQWIENNPLVRLIRLQPFDLAACKKLFGDDYDRALNLCRRDQSLLRLPAFAYMTRQRIRSDPHGQIRSRWDLYSRFLHRFLQEHGSYLGRTSPELWVRDLELALGQLSYKALSSATAELGVIPLNLLEGLYRELRVPLDELVATGVADLFEVDRHTGAACLVFSHSALQDAFAAKWVVESGCAHDVISECWNPKWRDVIVLVAGDEDRNTVEALYPDAQCDDPINHRLLLAAECAGQTTLPAALENRLIGDLRSLLTMDAFADDALRSLVCMNSHGSHDIAWELCIAQSQLRASGATLGSRLAPEHLRPLYTPERLEWLLLQLETEHFSPLGDLLVAAWADFIPPERASAILHRYLTDESVRHNQGLSHVISVLDAERIERLIQEMFPATHMIRYCHLDWLFDGLHQNVHLDSSHIDLLLDAAGRFNNHLAVARILESVSPRLSEPHLVRLSNEWWKPDGILRHVLLRDAPAVCSRLPDNCIDDLIELVDGSDDGVTGLAASVFRRCRHRLSEDRLTRLLSHVKYRDLSPGAVAVVMAATAKVPKWAAEKILAALSHDDWQVRTAAMKSCVRLGHVCGTGYWHVCADNLRTATEAGRDKERKAAIVAVSCSGGFLNNDTIWYILRTLKDGDFAPDFFDEEETVRHACERLSHALSNDQVDDIVRRICSAKSGRLAAGLCTLLAPERVSDEGLLRLSRHLRVVSSGPLGEQLLLFLRKAHDIGRLEGLREASQQSPPVA